MRLQSSSVSLFFLGCVSFLTGCGSPGTDGGTGNVRLPQSVGRFVVAAGEEKQSKAILSVESIDASGPVMLSLDPGDITFTAEESESGTLLVYAAFGAVPGFDTACADPEDAYGPFTVSVNGNSQVTGVSGTFEVAPSTVDLMTSGSYTICVTFSSDVAGTIIIAALTVE